VLYFEDLKVGQRRVIGTHVVPKDEAIAFARKWEPQPYHLDEAAAETSLYGGLTVCSLYLFAVCTRLFFQHEDQIAVMAMLGKDEVRLPNPARPGDALTYHTECVSKRPSRSRPDSGIVTGDDVGVLCVVDVGAVDALAARLRAEGAGRGALLGRQSVCRV